MRMINPIQWYHSFINWINDKQNQKCSKPTTHMVKSHHDNKIDDKVYEVSITNACQCDECTSGFTTFKTMRKFK
jgi:hypothetical protein